MGVHRWEHVVDATGVSGMGRVSATAAEAGCGRGTPANLFAVGPDGQPWIVNKQGTIFRRTKTNTGYVDGTWQVVPGQAGDIAIGATAPSGRLEYPGRTVAVT